jgi:hypothetical protein
MRADLVVARIFTSDHGNYAANVAPSAGLAPARPESGEASPADTREPRTAAFRAGCGALVVRAF